MKIRTKAILLLIVLMLSACKSKTPQERQQEMIKNLRQKYHKEIPDSVTVETTVVQAPCDTVFIDRIVNDTVVIRDTVRVTNPAVIPVTTRHKELRKVKKTVPNTVAQQSKPEYAKYTVKKGDTYYSIGKKYNIPVSELRKINGKAIKAGQVIKLPMSN